MVKSQRERDQVNKRRKERKGEETVSLVPGKGYESWRPEVGETSSVCYTVYESSHSEQPVCVCVCVSVCVCQCDTLTESTLGACVVGVSVP